MGPAPELNAERWQRLRALLDEALALPAAQRAHWLAALPAADAPLRDRLAGLIAHARDDTGDERFEALPALPPDGHEAAAEAAELPPPIGPYRPLRLLGVGGMSSVWLAERTDLMLQRPVALKLPRASWRHAGLAERMAQEREILARLDHPNIARLYDAGVAADGQPFLALEYVVGEPIDEHCRRLALDTRARVQLFLQVVDAVAHAHTRLVVHRDLKPSNILVNAEGQARLLDFGIAKLVGNAAEGQPELTQNAARVMTPWYAAPEQVLGEPVSTATDTYALGVVLYELLTGARPYRPARPTAAALEQAVLQAEPQRPSSVVTDPRLARALRGDLDTIGLQALKKVPAERYATVSALGDDLRHWLAERPVLARPDGARYRLAKYLRRNRLPLAMVGVVVLALSTGLAAALWQGQRARLEAAKATAIKDYLLGLFETNDIEQRDGLRKRQQSVQQLLEGSAATLGDGLKDQPEVRDELSRVVGQLLDNLALHDSALALRQQRVKLLAGEGAPVLLQVQATRELALSQRSRGDRPAARVSLRQALQACTDAGQSAALDCRIVQFELARLDYADRQVEAAVRQVEPVAEALRREAPGSLALAEALDLLGMLRLESNRADEAYGLLQEGIALKRALWGPQSVRLAIARFRLGRNLWNLRYLSQAEAELRAAWDIVREALGPEHVTSARIELNLGRLTSYLGLRPDGLAHLQHANDVIQRQAEQISPEEQLETQVVMGNALLLDGQLAASEPVLQQALKMRERLGSQPQGADRTLDQSWGRFLMDSGRFDEARAWFQAACGRLAQRMGPQHPDTADCQLRLARVGLAAGRPADAQAELQAVLASQDAREAAFGSVKHRAWLTQAAWLLTQGQAAQAWPLVAPLVAAAAASPRENQFRDVLFQTHEQAAQVLAALGRHAEALKHFEQAVALMAQASPQHPYLAEARANQAQSLLALGRPADAQAALTLARQALDSHPRLGPHLRRALDQATAALAASPIVQR